MTFLDFLQLMRFKAVLDRRFCTSLVFLSLIGIDSLGAQADRDKAPTEPELVSVFPLGGRQGSTEMAEIRGRGLEGAYAVWFDEAGLKAQIKEVEEIELEEKVNAIMVSGPKKARPGQRVTLQVEVDPSAKCGRHFLRVLSRAGVSNTLAFSVSSGSLMSVSESSTSHKAPAEAQPLSIPVVVNGKISEKGEVDYYSFEVSKDQELAFKVDSNILSLYPVFDVAEITLYEATGSWFDPHQVTRLAFHVNPPSILENPVGGMERPPADDLVYQFKKPGHYLLKVGTNLGIGGPDSFYRLMIVPEGHPVLSEAKDRSLRTVWQERLFDRKLEPNRLQLLLERTARTKKIRSNEVIAKGTPSNVPANLTVVGESEDLERCRSPLNTVKEREPNDTASQALEITLPTLIEGIVERPGDVDSFRFKVKAGQQLAFEIETPDQKPFEFIPRLAILDANGDETLTNHFRRIKGQYWFRSLEPKTIYTFEQGGDYTLQIRNITSRHGKAHFAYRVLIRSQIPHVGKIEVKEDHVNLEAGEAKKLTVLTELEEAFSGEITLEIENLPSGVRFFPTTEVEPEKGKGFEGGEGKKERFRAESKKTTIMLVANEDTPPTSLSQIARITARPISAGKLGGPLLAGEIPIMVVRPKSMSSKGTLGPEKQETGK